MNWWPDKAEGPAVNPWPDLDVVVWFVRHRSAGRHPWKERAWRRSIRSRSVPPLAQTASPFGPESRSQPLLLGIGQTISKNGVCQSGIEHEM